MIYSDSSPSSTLSYVRARQDFGRAHQRAVVRTILERLLGRRTGLCSFDEVRRRVGVLKTGARQLSEICLDRVLGSDGRAQDYTPDFLPLVGSEEERWARVRLAVEEGGGVPPIELYEVDGTYYVRDGHHRVSVFKRLGVKCFEAYVTKVQV